MPQLTPDQAMQLAIAHHRAGRLPEAESIYRQLLAHDPNDADALNLLGVIGIQAGRIDDGIALIRRAIQIQPDSGQYHNNLAHGLRLNKKPDEAIAACRRAFQLDPALAAAYNNLGIAYCDKRQYADAIPAFTEAASLQPDFHDARKNLADALRDSGRLDQAIPVYRDVLNRNPDFAPAWNNLGIALRMKGDLPEAITVFRRARELLPHLAEMHDNLGNVLRENGQYDEGIEMFREAIRLKPDYAETHSSLGLTLLLQGNFAEGWREIEWRHHRLDFAVGPKRHPQPQWDGRDLHGQTILLQWEQGIGDTIQLIRYAPMVAARGGKVIVQVQPALFRLLRNNPHLGQIISTDDSPGPIDFQCPMFSLPLAFQTDLSSIPAAIPYLTPDPSLVSAWAERLAPSRGSLRVGIVWAGNPTYTDDRSRSMSLAQFAPLAVAQNVTFYSLQKDKTRPSDPPPGLNLIDHTPDLTDFADTAAFIANLDLIISVDTAVAHLAGAMGKPIWILLPFFPDWRWMTERTDSLWYPTARLFRQKSRGAWTPVVDEVAANLAELGDSSSLYRVVR